MWEYVIEKIDRAINQLCRAARVRALYPVGHPSHANSLALARKALESLFETTDRLELTLTSEGLRCGDELLDDQDGTLRHLASMLRDQSICTLTVRRGLDEDGVRLLLAIFGGSADAADMDIVGRVAELQSAGLSVAQLDYERLVPRPAGSDGDGQTGGVPAGAELLRLLAASSASGGANIGDYGDVAAVIDDPQMLAAAMLSCVAAGTPGNGTGAGGGGGTGIGDGGGDGVGTGGDIPLVIAGHHIEKPHMAGALLALSIQRLAEMGCEARPGSPGEVFKGLAAAMRQLDPRLLAHVFRADVVPHDAPFDALQQTADHLSLDEVLDLVRAHPRAVGSEPSAVYRRLLRRIAPTGERLLQLAPVLKTGLIEDGMSEDVFSNTLGRALKDAADDRLPNDEPPLSGAAAAALMRTSDALRSTRRKEIAPLLQRHSETETWGSRAQLSTDLLELPGCCERHPNLLPALRECLRRLPDAERQVLSARIVEVIAPLAGPSGALPPESREVAVSLLAEASDSSTLEGLRRSLISAHGEQELRLARVLAMSGAPGREALLDILRRAGPAEADRLPGIVSTLVDIEAEEIVPETGLYKAALDPGCRQIQTIITALADRGGPVAARHLVALLREGDFGIRSEVVRSACQPGRSLLSVLVVALDDPDDDIRCAAAAGLGASGDVRAVQPLLRQLRPFVPWDPNSRLRVAAARALGNLGSPEAEPLLVKVLQRTSWLRRSECDELRAAAAEALLGLGTSRGLRELAAHTTGERSPAIQQAAAVALTRLRRRRGESELSEEETVHAV